MAVDVNWMRGLAVVVATSALMALGGCGSMVGSSGFTDEDRASEAPDEGIVRSLMGGIGAVDPNRKPIKYQPRSPLAVPPDTQSLPAPEDTNTVAEATGGQWPSEPEDRDRAMRLAGSAKERARLGRLQEGEQRMSVGELQDGAVEPGSQRNDTSLGYRERQLLHQDKAIHLSVYEMKNQRSQTPDATPPLDADGVPKRQYLTQPPSSYRVPSPNAPLTADEKKDQSWWRSLMGGPK